MSCDPSWHPLLHRRMLPSATGHRADKQEIEVIRGNGAEWLSSQRSFVISSPAV